MSRLAPGGYLHCATDWQPYAEQMLEVLSAAPGLRNTAAGYAPRPAWRPLTKFEHRGLEARPRRLGPGLQCFHSSSPVYAVSSTMAPKTMRYQAKALKSCVET